MSISLQHKRADATTTTTTDRGEFSALAAAYTLDRVGDRIVKGAFARTIEAWQRSGKQLPLHWQHSSKAEDIIGTVDPQSLRETDDGLLVEGKLHLEDSAVARESVEIGQGRLDRRVLRIPNGEGAQGQRRQRAARDRLVRDLTHTIASQPRRSGAQRQSLEPLKIARFSV